MSKIEVNQISSQCGSTLTIGQSTDTVSLAAGVGGIGTVSWDTTAKTAAFTAVSGRGYFVNTTSGAITVTLPASPSAGDIVAISDYAGTSITNNITVGRNGSNINGAASDLTIAATDSSITLVYVDATEGWKNVTTSNTGDIFTDPAFVSASGGTETTCGDYKIHKFTAPGTFTVSCAGNAAGSNTVDYLVVAGGGGGGKGDGGGGGAGGWRASSGTASGCYSAAPTPLAPTLTACVSALPVSATSYPITVGSGGAGAPTPSSQPPGTSGSNSVFSTITSAGGGFGAGNAGPSGANGGSGGGGAVPAPASPGGSGNTPPVSPPQGNDGGSSEGGGGGIGSAGLDGPRPSPAGTTGGSGAASSITASSVTYAEGGLGAKDGPSTPHCGAANTGDGGNGVDGGGPGSNASGAGGSGIVIIRYKYQ